MRELNPPLEYGEVQVGSALQEGNLEAYIANTKNIENILIQRDLDR